MADDSIKRYKSFIWSKKVKNNKQIKESKIEFKIE